MEKQKHTPGPWKVVTGAVFTDDDKPIADMVRDESAIKAGIPPVERDCNARLIAAAPELLASLKEMRDATAILMQAIHRAGFINEVMELIDHKADGFGARADIAIAKAEGN